MKQPVKAKIKTMKGLKLLAKILFPTFCLLAPLFLHIAVYIKTGYKKSESIGEDYYPGHYIYDEISYSEYLTHVEKSQRQKYAVPDFGWAVLRLDSTHILSLDSPTGAKAALYLIWLVFASGPISIIILFLLPYIKSRPKPKAIGKDTKPNYDKAEDDIKEFQKKYNIEPDDYLGLGVGTFLLSTGRRVLIERVHIIKTYQGFLEGRINKDRNTRLFQSLTYPKGWGDIKAYKISPSEEDFSSYLKGSFISVWLTSDTPIQRKNTGSQLIISWCDDFPLEEPLLRFFQNSLKDLHWTEIAEDFDY